MTRHELAERLRAAAVVMQRVHWLHDDECPHRHCSNCEPGTSAPEEDCEADADPCTATTCAKGAVYEIVDAAMALLHKLEEEERLVLDFGEAAS